MTVPYGIAKDELLDAALTHVPFDGWSDASFQAAITDCGMDASVAHAICPRGAVDLAVAYHLRGDSGMLARIEATDMTAFKFREKIAAAVRMRLEVVTDREIVRRGMALFALPNHAGEGAKLIWGTCDLIWNTLGDTSDDVNWYTKRTTLAAVYSSTVLYWLGDDSDGNAATWEFLDRRIENVMQIEKLKAQVRDSPTLSRVMAGPAWLLGQIKAPQRMSKAHFPGSWTAPKP
ncbi:MAG: COQ9 family protein [Sulfitobacter sp.]